VMDWQRHPDGDELIPRPVPSAADIPGDYLMTWRDEQRCMRVYEARVGSRVGQVVVTDAEALGSAYPEDVYLDRQNDLVEALQAAPW
jgi:hypothetical protein